MTIKSIDYNDLSLDFDSLRCRYQEGMRPSDLVSEVYRRIDAYPQDGVWISLVNLDETLARAHDLERQNPKDLPLYGIPFAVKDNIDVAHLPTTAACAAFAYTPEVSAPAVQRLLDAGAILVGKTNLDQFATGLVGTRSPYGVCANPFDARFIAGGSSSGSAVAVSAALVSFALGTDTAGSGRVPAAFNNIVGLKPSRGRVSIEGLVPACRSLDCVSVFALTVEDAEAVLSVMSEPVIAASSLGDRFRFGVPQQAALEFYGDDYNSMLFNAAIEQLQALGGKAVEIDFHPFREAAQLLYDGPWLAERYTGIREFYDKHAAALLPITREIIGKGRAYSAADLFSDQYRLQALQAQSRAIWKQIDLMLVPTAPSIYSLAEVAAEPLELNSRLGYYTNFVNLLDLCALALPNGFRADGLPFGITLIAPSGQDATLCELGARYQQLLRLPMGTTEHLSPYRPKAARTPVAGIRLAVVGAHLSGQPLNSQLISHKATLIRTCRTAPCYRFYLLSDTTPPKPGLVRVADGGEGVSIEVEIWELTAAAFGSFVADIPPPLGIGTVMLEDGDGVKGFLCEGHVVPNAVDISHFGGWRNYLAAARPKNQNF
ncbi:MAG TPA: allophanate hydrolase [Gammaproteobacteria bacterium]|jgi:allophanate hydrolase